MGRDARYVDPFGAAEVFCTGADFEAAAPGIVRVVMTCEDSGLLVAKVKLLLPYASMPVCITGATAFVAAHLVKRFTDDGSGQNVRLM